MSKCPKCGSEYFGVREDNTCLSCGWQRKTVFDKITASPEVLAKEFVAEFSIYGGRSYWCSLLLAEIGHSVFEQRFNTKEEAIAATVEELKKE